MTPNDHQQITERLIHDARRRNRRQALAGLLRGGVMMIVAAWCWFALDRIFRPDTSMRFLLLLAVAGLLLHLVVNAWRRWWSYPDLVRMARMYESKHPEFQDSLLTAVTLNEQSASSKITNSLLTQTSHQAQEQLAALPISFLDQPREMTRWLVPALLLTTFSCGCFFARPAVSQLWVQRCIMLRNIPIPTAARLFLPDFNPDKIIRVPRGQAFTLTVLADLDARRVPDRITLIPDHAYSRTTLRSFQPRTETIGNISRNVRAFTHTFENIQQSFSLSVTGADAHVDSLQVLCCERPKIEAVVAEVTLPDYLKIPPQRQKVLSELSVVEGSSVRLTIDCQPELTVYTNYGNVSGSSLDLGPQFPDSVEFYLQDSYGIDSHKRILNIKRIPDMPPELTASLTGLGPYITARAVGQCSGRLTDDFGLARSAFRVRVNDAILPTVFPLADAQGRSREFDFKVKFDFSAVLAATEGNTARLHDGDRVELILDVTDLRLSRDLALQNPPLPFDQTEGARLSLGSFNIVSPASLAQLLEQRESALRQRLLAQTAEVRISAKRFSASRAPAQGLPENQTPENDTTISEQVTTLLRQVEKEAFEVEHIASSVGQILTEADNNRLFVPDSVSLDSLMTQNKRQPNDWFLTGEYRNRLTEEVLAPLSQLTTQAFPALQDSLKSAMAPSASSDSAATPITQTPEQLFAEIVSVMEQVTQAMNQQNSFQSLLNDFQTIREELHSIHNKLQKERLNQLKGLVE